MQAVWRAIGPAGRHLSKELLRTAGKDYSLPLPGLPRRPSVDLRSAAHERASYKCSQTRRTDSGQEGFLAQITHKVWP